MNLLLYTKDFIVSNIYFLDKKTNMIMDGIFTKFVYSTQFMTMNGVYIDFPLKNVIINKIQSKNILQMDMIQNRTNIQKMIDIEKQILQYYVQHFASLHQSYSNSKLPIQNKTIVYSLKNQLQTGYIKYYKEYDSYNSELFYIKISGIWENQYEIGITFKLIEYQK
jgi:hypothetical protein